MIKREFMDFVITAQIYGIVSTAIAGTSYFTLYRPAIALTEEIVDRELNIHKGWPGVLFWFAMSALLSPFIAILLLRNNNGAFIEKFAVTLADKLIDDDE